MVLPLQSALDNSAGGLSHVRARQRPHRAFDRECSAKGQRNLAKEIGPERLPQAPRDANRSLEPRWRKTVLAKAFFVSIFVSAPHRSLEDDERCEGSTGINTAREALFRPNL